MKIFSFIYVSNYKLIYNSPVEAAQKKEQEKELVQKTLENPENFASIMHIYKAPLERYISRLAYISKDEIDHVLQDSFIKIYQNLNDFDTSLSLSSWIYRITHNQTIDYLRKQKNKPSLFRERELEFSETIPDIFTTEIDVDKKILSTHVTEILNALPSQYRSILILRFMEDKSYLEIEDILQKPPGTVSTLISRAKKAFKEETERYKLETKIQ